MIASVVLDIVLVAVLLVLAVWITVARAAFTAVFVFVAYGLLLTIAWVRLSAVDVALTEAAIGGGLTGMLLLGAAARLRGAKTAAPSSTSLRVAAAVFCAMISIALAAVLLVPPDIVVTLAPAAVAQLPPSGLGNPVAGVLFVYRAFDTMLEKVVLLLALLGVWSLTPDRLWGGVPGPHFEARPNSILTFLAKLLPPVGILVGIYMFWTGADHPGGAFQGGAVLAAMWILIMIAGLRVAPAIDRRAVRFLVVIGPGIFLAIGLAGFGLADGFLVYPAGYAKPLIIVVEAALTLSIGVTLALVALGPPNPMRRQ
jgi:multisubunit Na+/H+ antiporter MnhB subunit